jgi:hypothetical protein
MFIRVDKLTGRIEVLQGSYNVESASPSERTAVIGRDDGQQPVRDGIGMDDKREYQPVHQDPRGYKSV